jgi:hypothetical protein
MNLLTPDKVLQGMAEVQTGQTFNLSLPLDFPGGNVLNPRRQPPVLRPTVREGKPNMNYQLWCDDPACTDVVCDDLVIMHLQYSTQWDSLAHVGSMFDANGDGVPEPVYYNGFRAGIDVVGPSGSGGAGVFGFPEITRESTSAAIWGENGCGWAMTCSWTSCARTAWWWSLATWSACTQDLPRCCWK